MCFSLRQPLHRRQSGFSLAELLVALLILAQIATFTIPKVLNVQQQTRYNLIGKEAAAAFSQAYQLYRLNHTINANTQASEMTQYLNYVKVDDETLIDDNPGSASQSCGSSLCLRLHNGATLLISSGMKFGGTSSTHVIWFDVDPDSSYSGSTSGTASKSITIILFMNGRLATYGTITHDVKSSVRTLSPDPDMDPSWFSWD